MGGREKIPLETGERLERAGYRLVGARRRAAVKICTYTRKALLGQGSCYKQKFYGIPSHRCLQTAPDIFSCNHGCLFCWRDTRSMRNRISTRDDIRSIVRQSLLAQKSLLVGYKGNPAVRADLFSQSEQPNQVAISLAGEPTLFPQLGELIAAYRKMGCTTFVVSNGTRPEFLARLRPLPTQLYVTLPAPDERSYRRTCAPREKNLWRKILSTLRLLPKLRTRKVLRLTLARNLNFHSPEKYASLIKLARPHYVEVKSYVNVGYSTRRLARDNMLGHSEIRDFAAEIARRSGYLVADESEESLVVLLCRDKKAQIARMIRRK